jgi:hypothetical protein
VSSGEKRSSYGRAILRFVFAAAIAATSGCAYFHPAFVSEPSRIAQAAALAKDGLEVCERQSLTRTECTVMPREEVNRIFAETFGRH